MQTVLMLKNIIKEYYNLKINPESEKEILEKYKKYEASDIGWGFGDYMSELHCNYYGWEDEEEE